VFRLYCRSVPEHVRRSEAATQQEWRALLDSYDCHSQHVLEGGSGFAAWVGVGEREARVLFDAASGNLAAEALDLVESQVGRHGTLVLSAGQVELEREAEARGYTPLGVRLLCSRRLALLNPLKEVAAAAVISTARISR
jgi:hypothetical protein